MHYQNLADYHERRAMVHATNGFWSAVETNVALAAHYRELARKEERVKESTNV